MSILAHIDWSVTIGIAGGIIGAAGVFRSARLGALQSQISELTTTVNDLRTRQTILEVNLEEERKKAATFFTQKSDIADENRELAAENRALHKMLRERDVEIIDMQQNSLRALSS